ncbi:MAG: DUF3131 domain-containing protein [Clostridia bacterium]|nr:DUF3131 domain-containing protein [Clostridia bacterium]
MQQKAIEHPSISGLARLRPPFGMARRIRRAVQAVQRVPREDASPAAQWVEDHARLLLDAADALARGVRFAPKLPAVQGAPRLLLLAREAVKADELTAGSLTRVFRKELGQEALTQAEIDLLPQALTCALFESLSDLLDTCIQEPELYAQSKAWAAALTKGQKDVLPHDPMLRGLVLLRLDEREDADALRRADELLAQAGEKAADALQAVQTQWEQDGLRAERVISALRKAERLPYDGIAERLSPVAAALNREATYRRMDAESRAYYRKCACRAAKRFHVPEGEAAQAAVELAKNRPGIEGEAGYYLTERPEMIGAALGKKATGFARKHRQGLLLPPVYLSAALVFALAAGLGAPWYAWPLAALCGSDVFRLVYHRFLRGRFPARMLPRVRVDRLTMETRTLVVVPCLLTSRKQAMRMARHLAVLRAANPDPNLEFMLLGDFADNPEETAPEDEEILLAARLSMEALNRQQGGGFLYLHRARKWDMGQRRYTGRERKRGALEALNRLIVDGACRDTFLYMSMDGQALQGRYAYVITLDADTFLPAGTAYQLVGAMLHPLQSGRVNVIQPRMEISADTVRTRTQKLLGGAGGVDPYHLAVQDVYQDAFGKGSFVGKGIYAPAGWLKALEGRLPSGRLLSHDLIEGETAGSAVAEDIALSDSSPAALSGWRNRLHRWTRGDWQLLPFLADMRLSWLSRHKIWDNLRRSLVPAAQGILLLLGTGLNLPALFFLALPWPIRGMGQRLLLLPAKAQTTLDAIVRALWRQFVSRKNLLSWVTADQADGENKLPFSCEFMNLAAGAAMLLLAVQPGGFTPGVAVGVVWIAAPLLRRFFDAPASRQRSMTETQKEIVRQTARATWRFFEDAVSENTRFLPPDNVQTDPDKGPALRTSPTNIGLYLLSCCAARELNFITGAEMAKRLSETLQTLSSLQTWHGHFYNWYDLKTGEALSPGFVSTVDSGNLTGCLLCCAQICRNHLGELPEEAAELPAQLDALARRADFHALYDEKVDLFFIGWDTEADRPTAAHYDTLASEARLTSYLAILLGQVKRKHWARLNRAVTRAGGGIALLSWGGTMFEYLMPNLLLPLTPGTLLGESALNAIRAQMGSHPERPFGVSESGYASFDPEMNYQYQAFGLPALARSSETAGQVVAPYASMLALPFFPWAAAENLKRMIKLGWTDEHGLYEAADYTPQRLDAVPQLVKSHMAHHQGMILCSACNALRDNVLVKAFMTPPEAKAQADLLLERAPSRAARRREFPSPRQAEASSFSLRRAARPGLPVDAHALFGAGTSWVLTAQGQGRLEHKGMMATRFFPEAGAQTGPQVYIKGENSEAFLRPAVQGNAVFEGGAVRYQAVWEGLQMTQLCCVDPLTGAAVTALRIENPGPVEKRLQAVSFLEIAQSPEAVDAAHPNFRDLSVRISPWGEHGLLSERLPRDENDRMPVIGHTAAGDGLVNKRQGDRFLFLGRLGTYARPAQLTEENTPCRIGDVTAPCCSLTVSLRIPAHKKSTVYFVTAFAETKEELERMSVSASRVQAAFSLAATQAAMTARMLRMDGNAMELCRQMVGSLLFNGQPHQQAFPPAPQSALWRWGISGTLPVLLVRVEESAGQALIRHSLRAHAWMRLRGVAFDLLFFCPEEKEYQRPCHDRVTQCLQVSPDRGMLGQPGGVFLAEGTETEALALESLARLTLRGGQSIRAQLNAMRVPLPGTEEKPLSVPDPVLPGKLMADNGFGGYTHDGAYCVHAPAPVPWHQLVCGTRFGTLVCETGILSSFVDNSRLGRVTRQTPDVYRGVPSEEIYLMDEESRVWPLTRGAAVYEPGMAAYHAMAEQILCQTTVFSHTGKPYGVRTVTLRSEKEQRLKLYWLARFALGERPESTRCLVNGAMVTAHSGDFSGVAWAAMENASCQALSSASCFGMAGEDVPPALLASAQGVGSVALLCAEIVLPPREPRRITLALGCARSAEEALRTFADLLNESPADIARSVRGFWGDRLSRLLLFSYEEGIMRMVNRWLPYQARASRLLGRVGPYQAGGAFGFRDQLQDCLALLYTEPEFVREHILLCAAHQYKEGDVQHWWHSPRRGVRTRVSDDKLFLPWLTAKYIQVTDDSGILEEQIPCLDSLPLRETETDRYEEPDVTPWTEPLFTHCLRAMDSVALGEHGLPLMGAGDWNDGMNRVGGAHGESVWLGFFYALTLKEFSPYCPGEIKEKYQALRRQLLDGAESAWTGQWYLRAWYDDGTPLAGPDTQPQRIDLISQCFAVLGGAPRHHARAALAAAVEKLYDREAGIVKLLDPPFAPTENAGYIGAYLPGVRENGGQYTHAVPWLILALCQVGETGLAWEIARAILPENHSGTKGKALVYRAEPYVLCGDVYAGENRGRGGWSWYTGSAAWLYWVIVTELLGFEKRGDKARLHPVREEKLSPFTLIYRFGTANFHFTAAPDCLFPTLDGVKSDDGWVTLVSDGKTHEARFPLR